MLHAISPQAREIFGVHHTKFAVFDNSIILTGANFEEQYFLNRRDRYWIVNDCEELANYLEDYSLNLMSASEMLSWEGESFGVSAHSKKSTGFYDKISSMVGLTNSGSYSSIGEGFQTKGLSQAEFKQRIKHMMGVFTYLGYKDALGMKENIEKKMLETGDSEKVEELESGSKEIAIASGESKEEVLQR